MSLRAVFWALAALNIIFITLAVLGYPVITVVVVLLLIDIMILETNRRSEGQQLVNEVKNSLSSMSEKIENILSKISPSENPGMQTAIEQRLRQHEATISSQLDVLRNFIRADIKDALDRMATKMIDIENALNRTKKTLGATVAMFDERVGQLENINPGSNDEYIEIEPTDEL
ncbi:MAG: hypothetical protein QW751_00955 [Candidatus Aenigmatarchaeota archaeon]|nr:hypothetical protein [Candidatus Aenigmarchaeota archaeon]